MRTDRALEIALHPTEHDVADVVNALVALRVAFNQQAAVIAAAEPARLELGDLRRERADVDGRRRSAVLLWEQASARLARVLELLDGLDPAAAKECRTEWGVWADPPR